MKLRLGFVSNSSTSSFVIYGYKIPLMQTTEEKINFIKKIGSSIVSEEIIEKFNTGTKEEKSDAQYEIHDIFCDRTNSRNGSDLTLIRDGDNGYLFVVFLIAKFDENFYIPNCELSLSELAEKTKMAKDVLGEYIKDSEAKLFSGEVST